ncbi:MAG: GSCFA domain-containing protein [Muribaculaceae bacterium]|nr:GSCFA domain-containing protein [Muribaculaceae bacterium]
MEFRTTIHPREGDNFMRHSDKMMLMGSCFSDNIGARLKDAMVDVVVNPFGTIFNPLSIASSVHKLIDCEVVAGMDLFLANGVWNCYDFHSRFSMANKDAALERMNDSIKVAHNHLRQCKTLVLTLGTAVVYRRRDTGEVVNNCHKVPQHEFTRRLASVEECTEALNAVMARLHEFNPELRVLFTVSPIRHIADGLEMNSLSKAVLRVAVNNVVRANKEWSGYFPAYEIVIDDLRDYRFYTADMVHPSDVAIEYIWQTFQATYFDDRSTQAIARCERVSKRLKHRPMSNNPDVVARFNADTEAVIANLKKEYPYINA